jgi:poly(3-hydroxybutyrate) depolymerase
MRFRTTRRALLQALCCICFAACALPAHSEALPAGTSQRIVDVGGTAIEVHFYKPAHYDKGPLLVSFHGLNRNMKTYREAARGIADHHGMLLVMPLFDRPRFPYWRYQALGITHTNRKITSGPIAIEPQAQWTGTLILKLIDQVRNDEGHPALDYYLIGHSAGGQVVNRFAALVPNSAKRMVVANPSSYVRPSLQARFPYGFGGLPENMADEPAIRRYLAQPMTILLGTADVLTKNLDQLPLAMQQGATRYERGRNAFHAAQELARDKGWEFNWRLVEVPGVGHDAKGMYRSAQAEAALFGR